MVGRKAGCLTIFLSLATAALAQSPQDRMFPRPDSCYARSYTAQHLAEHPAQRVTAIAIRPDAGAALPFLGVQLDLSLRGTPGGAVAALASCENEGSDTLYCTMEGDAGGFQITTAKGGAILITVSSLGMSFETDTDFVTLAHDAGDDRSFLLKPAACP